MAKCDEGYVCRVCGEDVENITQSDLYLRYVIGMIDPETLHTTPERHIHCNPALAQFIVADQFEPARPDEPFDKRHLDGAFVAQRERMVTAGWHRLNELASRMEKEEISVLDFPLPEARELLGRRARNS